jgi:hypothetical protein
MQLLCVYGLLQLLCVYGLLQFGARTDTSVLLNRASKFISVSTLLWLLWLKGLRDL